MSSRGLTASQARQRAARLRFWSAKKASPRPIDGGISNFNFLVEDDGARYFVRIGEDAAEHAVYRFNEVTVAQAAERAGFGPPVRYHEPGALVLDYLDGARPLPEGWIEDDALVARVVALLRRAHLELPQHLEVPGPMFWPFQANDRYLRLLASQGGRLSGRLEEFAALNRELEAAVGAIRPVFCHNDLMPGNLLDDGERLWLVDWEYGGWNCALFDLANLAGNNGMARRQEMRLLALYDGEAPDLARWRGYLAMKGASALREALWSRVAELHSALDFDYAGYTDGCLAKLAAAAAEYRELANGRETATVA